MNNDTKLRLQFLTRVISKETLYLQQTSERLFSKTIDPRLLANSTAKS